MVFGLSNPINKKKKKNKKTKRKFYNWGFIHLVNITVINEDPIFVCMLPNTIKIVHKFLAPKKMFLEKKNSQSNLQLTNSVESAFVLMLNHYDLSRVWSGFCF